MRFPKLREAIIPAVIAIGSMCDYEQRVDGSRAAIVNLDIDLPGALDSAKVRISGIKNDAIGVQTTTLEEEHISEKLIQEAERTLEESRKIQKESLGGVVVQDLDCSNQGDLEKTLNLAFLGIRTNCTIEDVREMDRAEYANHMKEAMSTNRMDGLDRNRILATGQREIDAKFVNILDHQRTSLITSDTSSTPPLPPLD